MVFRTRLNLISKNHVNCSNQSLFYRVEFIMQAISSILDLLVGCIGSLILNLKLIIFVILELVDYVRRLMLVELSAATTNFGLQGD